MAEPRAAAFVDRDGTIIVEREYAADPAAVRLVPGAAEGLRRLRAAGYALVVVTNQSGIARGLYTFEQYAAVQQRVAGLLEERGIGLEAVYYCPHHPDFSGPCTCRKPALGMYRAAVADLGVALDRSVYIGDRLKDVLPALATGGTGILVRTGYGEEHAADVPAGIHVVADLAAAAELAAGAQRARTVH